MEYLSGKPIKTTRTMKKIFGFLMSAVALVGFAACSEDVNEINVEKNDGTVEVSLFASFDEDTRMTLNDKTPTWEAGDVIYINGVEFTADEAGSNVRFTGNVTEDMIGQAYTAYFGTEDGKVAATQTAVAGHMSKETPATAEIADFQSGMQVQFKNAAALLQFTPLFSGDVTFAVDGGETVTLAGCEANNVYYVAVTPATWENGVAVTSCVLPIKKGAVGQVIERNKIYPLGTLNLPTADATWGIAGNFQGWSVDSPEPLYALENNWLVACNLKNLNGGFKFVQKGTWDDAIGLGTHNATEGAMLNGGAVDNITTSTADGYDVYFNTATQVYIYAEHNTKVDLTTDSNKLYYVPNHNHLTASARFAAYFFGNGEKWVSMTKLSGDVYVVDKQAGYPNVIFCRMNPGATANNWDNKWNQTADLTVPTNGDNVYVYNEGGWDKAEGFWTKF